MFRAFAYAATILLAACTVGEVESNRGPGGGADAAPGADTGSDPTAPDGAPGQPTAREVLEAFGACMLLADWEAEGLGAIALVQSSAGPCYSCHSNGTGNNYLSQDSLETFERIRTFPYVQRYAKTDGDLQPIVSQDLVVKGQGGAHPSYVLPPALEQGIQNFFDLTNARYAAGDCPPAP